MGQSGVITFWIAVIKPQISLIIPFFTSVTIRANALLDVKFVTNRLGKQSLVHKGYLFRVEHRRDNRFN